MNEPDPSTDDAARDRRDASRRINERRIAERRSAERVLRNLRGLDFGPREPSVADGQRVERRRAVLEEQLAQPVDQLRSFRQLLTAVRWASIALGIGLWAINGAALDLAFVLGGAAIALNAAWRTVRPLEYRVDDNTTWAAIVFELVLHIGIVLLTGVWESPWVFCLSGALVAIGLVRGLLIGTIASLAAVAVIAPASLVSDNPDSASSSFTFGGELILIGVVAGYANRLFGEARAQATAAMSRIGRLAEANALLFELHQVAQTLPVSLDLSEVVRSTAERIQNLVSPDVLTLIVREEASDAWVVAISEGARLPASWPGDRLPEVLARAAEAGATILVEDLSPEDSSDVGFGLAPGSYCGLYAPLLARRTLVGLVAIEHRSPDGLGRRHLGLVDGLAEQAALAIDNARWFSRLRTVGAEEERLRIARDLHDRVGQSLAYLAFELDRISAKADKEPIAEALGQLRTDVRKVVTEVRETLYDLRTEVSETKDLSGTLEGFLDRVRSRANLEIELDSEVTHRPPLLQERELWRIAAEAITNIERHAQATRAIVRYRADEDGAVLEVKDNGKGFSPGLTGRPDSYGVTGMRERADAIGAVLQIESAPGEGTTVRCSLGRSTLRE